IFFRLRFPGLVSWLTEGGVANRYGGVIETETKEDDMAHILKQIADRLTGLLPATPRFFPVMPS
ncbi:MAG: hypothetical protein AAF568_10290, partial [Pseudomonadota bacterium]